MLGAPTSWPKRPNRVITLTMCTGVLMACALPVTAEQAPAFQETMLEGCRATVHAPDFPEVGAPIPCEIRVTGTGDVALQFDPRSLVVSMPPATLGVFDVLSISTPRVEQAADGTVYAICTVVLSTLDAGTQTPDPLVVMYTAGGVEREGRVLFPSFPVTSLLGEEIDPANYRDIQGPIEIPEPVDWMRVVVLGSVCIALAAVGWWAYQLWRRRARRVVEPDAWAIAALAQLERAPYLEEGDFARFYDALTSIARRYTAARFAIPAEQQTTREFLDSVASREEFPTQERDRLQRVLRLADLVKFASATRDHASCLRDIAEVRAFVEATRPHHRARDGGAS